MKEQNAIVKEQIYFLKKCEKISRQLWHGDLEQAKVAIFIITLNAELLHFVISDPHEV